MRFITNEVRKR